MKLSEQLAIKSDLMSTIEYYLNEKPSSIKEYGERYYYEFDSDLFETDENYKKEVTDAYNKYVETIEYKNQLIYKLSDYLYKI